VQYTYCPRKVYFLKVMGVPMVVKRKMEYGREVHERERQRMMERKQIYGFDRDEVEEVLQGLQIEAPEVGLRGKVDVALRLKTGEFIPVETKYTDEMTIQRRYRKQLHAYALLLDHRFKTNVRKGVLYFAKQRQSRIVEIGDEEKQSLIRDIHQIQRMISSEAIPKRVSPMKCEYCEVKKYCV
ncbi:MAG: CRISPR-associated protein Cas4, partial [Candidatus Bathyarchaeia archaeon]